MNVNLKHVMTTLAIAEMKNILLSAVAIMLLTACTPTKDKKAQESGAVTADSIVGLLFSAPLCLKF